MSAPRDVVVVGSGPNGLTAAARLARAGASVLVLEQAATVGGGTRTAELTLPGFAHDVCSACHPLGGLSPAFSDLRLTDHGLRWLRSGVSFAHPLDDRPAVVVDTSLAATAERMGADASRWRRLVGPLLEDPVSLVAEVLAPPLHLPHHPLRAARLALPGALRLTTLARLFNGEAARAALAGCAAHGGRRLDAPLTGAMALLFLATAHADSWPVAEGGSQSIADALVGVLEAHGGAVETGHTVRSLRDLPPARLHLFDLAPRQVLGIAGDALPPRYRRALARFRHGPAVFKVDWALDGPIPWRDPGCATAPTVHLGGTLAEIAHAEAEVAAGRHPDAPFVLVCQQSVLDPGRAPAGGHTGWAYCHVPQGSTLDRTEVVERQVERFAPGFSDRILARAVRGPAAIEAENPAYVGGAIDGGVLDLRQWLARPALRLDPYSTPNPRLLLCGASTPPGAGVHGMCGWNAAGSALRRLPRVGAATAPG